MATSPAMVKRSSGGASAMSAPIGVQTLARKSFSEDEIGVVEVDGQHRLVRHQQATPAPSILNSCPMARSTWHAIEAVMRTTAAQGCGASTSTVTGKPAASSARLAALNRAWLPRAR